MRHLRAIALILSLAGVSLLAGLDARGKRLACAQFPPGLIPFSLVHYVSDLNAAGDRLVVGALPMPGGLEALAKVPLPSEPNQKFCGEPIQLAPGKYYYNVYVPTVLERQGDFSPFAGLLKDPSTNAPFPGGLIPQSRLGAVYAWRIGALGALPRVSAVVKATGDREKPVASPRSLISIYGEALGSVSQTVPLDATGRLPTRWADTEVSIGNLKAPLLFVSPGQINAQVPVEIEWRGSAYPYTLAVTTAVGRGSGVPLWVSSSSPGVFRGGVVKNADFSVVNESNPVRPGDVLVVYCTGLGLMVSPSVGSGQPAPLSPLALTTARPTVSIGGVAATVVNSLLSPGFVGLYQIGLIVPPLAPSGPHPLVLYPTGTSSTPVDIPIDAGQRTTALYPGERLAIPGGLRKMLTADWNRDGIGDLVATDSTSGTRVFLGTREGWFEAARVLLSSWEPVEAVTDLNGDGLPDLVTTAVEVHLQKPDGTLHRSYEHRPAGPAAQVVVADFNGDRLPDLLVEELGDPRTATVLLNLGAGTFRVASTQPLPGASPVVGDLNRDGKADVVTLFAPGPSWEDWVVSVVLARGDGTFMPEVRYPLGYSLSQAQLALGDMNRDGAVDLVICQSGQVAVLWGDGKGGFRVGPKIARPELHVRYRPMIVELNGDGNPDLIVQGSDRIVVLRGVGDGTFAPLSQVTLASSGALSQLDYDHDGNSDLAIPLEESAVGLFRSLGDGMFEWFNTVDSPGGLRLAVGDLTGDAVPDVVASASDGRFYVFSGKGDGGFTPPSALAAGGSWKAVLAVDADGDTTVDIVAAGNGTKDGVVVLGKGGGQFHPAQSVPLGVEAEDLLAADFNHDGRIDLVAGKPGGREIAVVLGNGQANFRPPLLLPLEFAYAKSGAGDVDGDGVPDLLVGSRAPGITQPTAVVLYGNPDGTFGPSRALPLPTGSQSLLGDIVAFGVGDLTGDGLPDVAVATRATSGLRGFLVLLRGSGGRGFAEPREFGVDSLGEMLMADADGDGRVEILAARGLGEVVVLKVRPEGTFGSLRGFSLGWSSRSQSALLLADLNRDGRPDLIANAVRWFTVLMHR